MQAVREGSWWRAETDSQLCELEGVASLQQLAASVMGDGESALDPDTLDSPAGSPAAAAPAEAVQHAAPVLQQKQVGPCCADHSSRSPAPGCLLCCPTVLSAAPCT
jgi:hypothetical protein